MSIENYKLFKWIGGKSWISNKLNEKTNEIITDLKNNGNLLYSNPTTIITYYGE